MGNDDGRIKKTSLSRNYADPTIALKQRELVDRQLAAMHTGQPPEHFASVGAVLARIQRDDVRTRFSLLDVGCGSAYYSEIIEYFAPDLIDYTGCDYNPGMVALANERYPTLPIYECDARNLSLFNDESFDIVLSGALIAHVREWRKVLSELARVSRRWLVLHRTWVHTDDTPTTREMKDAYGQQVLYYTFNESELMGQVKKLGFDLVDTYQTGETTPSGQVLTYLFRKLESVHETSYRRGVLQPGVTLEPATVSAAPA